MSDNPSNISSTSAQTSWQEEISVFMKSDIRKAVLQLANTLFPFFALWILMVYLMNNGISYWILLVIALLTGLMQVRIFIIFHDCCHGSFISSRKANQVLGVLTGILTFTPFAEWRRNHNIHHATSGNLDRRGTGDVWTMTVAEFYASGKLKRFMYRLYRHPLVMFGLGPLYLFTISMRLTSADSRPGERRSVWLTNLALLLIISGLGYVIGYKTYLLIQIPILVFAGMAGIWLFYVQHQFEEAYWKENEDWNLIDSALFGSSYYKLPGLLQWFTGNIGLHHIHHMRPRIPNYFLQKCQEDIPCFRNIKPLTIISSLKTIRLNLWDEDTNKMVSFRSL